VKALIVLKELLIASALV